MFKLFKLLMVLSFILWASLIFHIIGLEVVGLMVEPLIVTGVITMVLLVIVYAYFIYFYVKNKKKINDLKKQYLESLKPDKPLRFCPTDEELLQKYKSQEKLRHKVQLLTKEEEHISTEEDEEMEEETEEVTIWR